MGVSPNPRGKLVVNELEEVRAELEVAASPVEFPMEGLSQNDLDDLAVVSADHESEEEPIAAQMLKRKKLRNFNSNMKHVFAAEGACDLKSTASAQSAGNHNAGLHVQRSPNSSFSTRRRASPAKL